MIIDIPISSCVCFIALDFISQHYLKLHCQCLVSMPPINETTVPKYVVLVMYYTLYYDV